MRMSWLSIALLVGFAASVYGQDPAPAEPARDPFETSEAMRRAADSPVVDGGVEQTRPEPEVLPPLRVKGLLCLAGHPPGALLAIGERTWVVRVGDELVVDHRGRELLVRVVSVDAAGVGLAVGGDDVRVVR
jgi:hypothetical protein